MSKAALYSKVKRTKATLNRALKIQKPQTNFKQPEIASCKLEIERERVGVAS